MKIVYPPVKTFLFSSITFGYLPATPIKQELTMRKIPTVCLLTALTFFNIFLCSAIAETPDCKVWAKAVLEKLGAVYLDCGATGATFFTEGLVTRKTPLQRKKFQIGDEGYIVRVTYIDRQRHLVTVRSATSPSHYQEKLVKGHLVSHRYLPDMPLGASGHIYYWNAAIEYDLRDQMGLVPVSSIKAAFLNSVRLYVAHPGKVRRFFPDIQGTGSVIVFHYRGGDRWVMENTASGMTIDMRYEAQRWQRFQDTAEQDTGIPSQFEQADDDLLFDNSDFERGTLHNWYPAGSAFDHQPTLGDNVMARGRGSSRHQGRYWVGTFEHYTGNAGEKPGSVQGDKPTGSLASIPFTIRKNTIRFRIGGGRWTSTTYVSLLVQNREVLKATGRNREEMHETTWNVSRYRGRRARIRIKDMSGSGFGHINVDDFRYAADAGTAFETNDPDSTAHTGSWTSHKTPRFTKPSPVPRPVVDGRPSAGQTEQALHAPGRYEGWFPFADAGWTANTCRVRSVPGTLLEVRKTYRRNHDGARLEIFVKNDDHPPAPNGSAATDPDEVLPQLLGTLIEGMLQQSGVDVSTGGDRTVVHQGVKGTLSTRGGTTALVFYHQGRKVTLQINRADSRAPLDYAGKLDLRNLSRVFQL